MTYDFIKMDKMDECNKNIDKYNKLLSELKFLGVKVPKAKKFVSSIPKQDKTVQHSASKIFGVPLSDQEKTTEDNCILPKFIASCTAYLRKYIEKEIGLFRKAGSVARQRDLRTKLENGESIDKSEPNDVASLLKQWLRELPEPLIPSYLQDIFIRCQNLEAEETRMTAILLACLLLPDDHLHTLKHILCFLADIAACSNKNKMGCHNLAVIMAPNIFVIGSECIDKSSNNLVQLYTSLVELLIKNADQIGDVPSTVHFLFPIEDTLKCNLNFETSLEILDDSPSKSKRRKSATVQDFLSGIKKLVGQNSASPAVMNEVTPNVSRTGQSWVSWSAAKRKADPDQHSISAKKKKATSSNGLQNVSLNFTPKIFQNNVTKSVEKKGFHSRKKSFGLLRRKEKKRQKSPKSNASSESVIHLNVPDSFKEKLSDSFLDNSNAKGINPENFSPLFSPSEIESIIQRPFNVKKCLSDCYLTGEEPLHFNSTLSASTPNGFSGHSENSPCIRPDNTMLNESSPTFKSKSNHPIRSVSSTYFLRSKKSASSFQRDSTSSIAVTQGSNLNKSITPSPYNLRSSEINNCNSADKISKISNNECKVALEKTPCSRKRRSLPLQSEIDVIVSSVGNSSKSRFSDQSTVCKVKETIKMNTKSSFNRSLNSLPSSNRKGSLRTRHQVSQKKREPINVMNVVSDKEISKTSLVLQCSTDTKVSNKENSLSGIEIKSRGTKQGMHSAGTLENKTNKTITRAKSLNRNCSHKVKSNLSTQNISNEDNFNVAVFSMKSSDVKINNCTKICSDEKVKSVRKGTIVRGRPNTINSGLPLNSKFNNESIQSLTNIESEENYQESIPQDIEIPECNFNNSFVFKTPITDIFNKEQAWKSSKQFLDENFLTPCEVFNKRESIAMIIKNNSGHVQAKINLYDHKITSSCSTSSVFETSANSFKSVVESSETNQQKESCELHHICSEYLATPNVKSKKKQSSFKRQSIAYKNANSTPGLNDSSNKINNFKSPLPQNYLNVDFNVLTPKLSYPLREATNDMSSSHASQKSSFLDTPVKDSVKDMLSASKLTNNIKMKHKRNSDAGRTPYKLHKISRSESSPLLFDMQDKFSHCSLESANKNKSSALSTNNKQKSSSLKSSCGILTTVENESSPNFDNLRSDQMLDEWQCEV